jgi:hypothetical protein
MQLERLLEEMGFGMCTKNNFAAILLLTAALGLCWAGEAKRDKDSTVVDRPGTLWQNPVDIASRNLIYGIGGKRDAPPPGKFTFLKEDLEGTNPKFDVKDRNGVRWKVKLGIEARSETAASRIVWAAGYYANEDYFVPELHVEGMPARLHRGQKLIGADGLVRNVRLKREDKAEKKIGIWSWRQDPFTGTRELNGLKVAMALINNWDLKDVNNAVYQDGSNLIYMVSDLGASFGSAGRTWPFRKAKDNLDSYRKSRFIRGFSGNAVNFETPGRPRWMLFVNPKEYFMRVHLEWIGRNVPRDDARWMGRLLAGLSPQQIGDAFRAAGYTPEEVAEFSRILSSRITVLIDL